jgi:hypothetical protein
MRLKSAQATRDEELSRIEVERIQKEEVVLAVYNVDKDLRLAPRRNPKKKPVPEVDLTAASPGVDSALMSIQRPTPFAALFSQRSSSSVSQESSLSSHQKKKKFPCNDLQEEFAGNGAPTQSRHQSSMYCLRNHQQNAIKFSFQGCPQLCKADQQQL